MVRRWNAWEMFENLRFPQIPGWELFGISCFLVELSTRNQTLWFSIWYAFWMSPKEFFEPKPKGKLGNHRGHLLLGSPKVLPRPSLGCRHQGFAKSQNSVTDPSWCPPPIYFVLPPPPGPTGLKHCSPVETSFSIVPGLCDIHQVFS